MFKKLITISSKNSKKNSEINSIKKNKSTQDIFSEQKEEIKTSAYYQKLYSGNLKLNKNFLEPKTTKQKKISLRNVFKKPNYPKPEFQFRKITNPKSPFSSIKKESKEEIKERLKLKRPSRLFHNFINIQWLRKKFPETVINKSIYTLLPNNGKPVVPDDESEEDKRHRLMIEYLESLKGPIGRDQYIDINPKYFFNKQTWETVLKLKQIFLDFDADGNRRMELDEMQEMFESNKIPANINDLVDLFFKGKKFKESEIMKLYLNFHQFINFALTKDKEFREFMRNIREKVEKENKKETNKTKTNISKKTSGVINETTEYNEKEEEDEEDKRHYFPMNFKSLLDYFVDRGKQRESREIIDKAIKEMNNIINISIKKLKPAKKKTIIKEKKSSINSEKVYTTEKSIKMNEEEANKSNSNNNNATTSVDKRKTLLTQKTIIPSKIKDILKEIKNMKNNTTQAPVEDESQKLELELEEEEDDKIDYDKQLKDIDFNKLINEFSNLFSVPQFLKRKIKNNESNIRNEKQNEIKEKKEKKEETSKEPKNNNENINKKILKKNNSQNLLNTMTTLTKDTLNKKHIIKSNSLSNIKINKNKLLAMNDFKFIDKNIKLPFSHPHSNRNIKNNNNKNIYFTKMSINYKSKKSFNQGKMPQFLEDIKENSKDLYKIKDDIENTRDKLPLLKYFSRKNKSKSFNNSTYLKNRNKNIFPISKEESFNIQRNKIDLNLPGGKINLFRNDIIMKIPKSNSKLDYVPFGLLFNNNKSFIQYEKKV